MNANSKLTHITAHLSLGIRLLSVAFWWSAVYPLVCIGGPQVLVCILPVGQFVGPLVHILPMLLLVLLLIFGAFSHFNLERMLIWCVRKSHLCYASCSAL